MLETSLIISYSLYAVCYRSPLSLVQWYNMCLKYDSETDSVTAIVNGDIIASIKNEIPIAEIPSELSVINMACMVSSESAFRGHLTDVQIWSKALEDQDAIGYSKCQGSEF